MGTLKQKATHKGSCQWCGKAHKVNEFGKLSTHGYKVHEFEGFVGQCRGSGHQSIQTSCEEVKKSIGYMDEAIAEIEERKNAVSSGERLPNYRHYKKGFGYYWVRLESILDRVTLTYSEGTIDLSKHAGLPYGDKESTRKYCAEMHINQMVRDIASMQRYRSSQQKIVDNWVPTCLIPVK